jgi:hypothetical protein
MDKKSMIPLSVHSSSTALLNSAPHSPMGIPYGQLSKKTYQQIDKAQNLGEVLFIPLLTELASLKKSPDLSGSFLASFLYLSLLQDQRIRIVNPVTITMNLDKKQENINGYTSASKE